MPAREKQHLFDFLDLPTYEILSALKDNSKTFTELSKFCSLSVSNFNDRLDWLVAHGLVREELQPLRKGRSKKVYFLTPTGKRILELLEEIERVFEEGYGEDRELREMERELEELGK